jgi:hypothetical protein
MTKNDYAGKGNLAETLAPLGRIVPYCSRSVTIGFAYAGDCSVIPLGSEFSLTFSRKLAFGQRISR